MRQVRIARNDDGLILFIDQEFGPPMYYSMLGPEDALAKILHHIMDATPEVPLPIGQMQKLVQAWVCSVDAETAEAWQSNQLAVRGLR